MGDEKEEETLPKKEIGGEVDVAPPSALQPQDASPAPPPQAANKAAISVAFPGVKFVATGLYSCAALVGVVWILLLIFGDATKPNVFLTTNALTLIVGTTFALATQAARIGDLKTELELRNVEIDKMAKRYERLERLIIDNRRSSTDRPPTAAKPPPKKRK